MPSLAASLVIFILFLGSSFALGINCRGSGLCPLATWDNPDPDSVVQVLRDAVWDSTKDNSTTYNSGDHIICVSESIKVSIGIGEIFQLDGSIGAGGICLFPQQCALTLGQIRPLTDALLNHGCKTCGSVPIHFVDEGSNDPSDGILTFNYVSNPVCDGDCISDNGGPGSSPSASVSVSSVIVTTSVLVQSSMSAAPSEASPTALGSLTVTQSVTLSQASITTTDVQSAADPTTANVQLTAAATSTTDSSTPTVTATVTASPSSSTSDTMMSSPSRYLLFVLLFTTVIMRFV